MNVVAGSFWGSRIGLLIVLAAVFVGVFLLITMLGGVRARQRREQHLAARIGKRDQGAEPDEDIPTQWVPTQFADAGHRFAEAMGIADRLDARLEAAGMPVLAGEFIALIALCALAGAVFGGLLLQNIIFVLLIAGIAAVIPYYWMTRSLRKRQDRFGEQLADTLSILASSLRAGYSFLQAIDTVSKEIGEPSAGEFQRVVAEIRLGRPVEDALTALADRIGSDDLRWAVIAINVQRQVGGNLAEVLDTVSATVRERAYIRRQVKVLSAEGRMSVAILSALPFLILLYLAIVNPGYLNPLFSTTAGIAMLTGAGIAMALGIFIMTRMVKIDV